MQHNSKKNEHTRKKEENSIKNYFSKIQKISEIEVRQLQFPFHI